MHVDGDNKNNEQHHFQSSLYLKVVPGKIIGIPDIRMQIRKASLSIQTLIKASPVAKISIQLFMITFAVLIPLQSSIATCKEYAKPEEPY